MSPPNLTLNLGVRYDLYTPYTDTNNILSNFDTNVGKIVVAGTPGVDGHGNVKVDYTNFAPRVGFAFTPVPKTVIRGGFGLSFAPENLTSGSALVNQPFNATIGPCSTTSPCAPGFVHFADGIPTPVANSAINPTGSVSAALDPNFKSTYIEQFNLTAEREFLGNVATLSYVGELGRRLAYYISDVNEASPNSQSYVNPKRRNPCRLHLQLQHPPSLLRNLSRRHGGPHLHQQGCLLLQRSPGRPQAPH